MMIFEGISLDKGNYQHLYIQLYTAIKELVFQGKLKEGDRLPPVRKMASLLGVNNVTVVKAYEILEKESIVYKKIGSGTYVSPHIPHMTKNIKRTMVSNPPGQPNENTRLMTQGRMKIEEHMINFASATPSAELFPVEEFKQAINEVLDRDQGFAFGYQEGQGYYPLREVLKAYIEEKGMLEDAENIHIISGAQQGIDIVSKALLTHGDYVLTENPTYTGAMGAFQSRGAKIIELPLEEDGLKLELVEKKIKTYRPKLLYVMPNFQNPTGISYSRQKKEQLIEWACKYDLYILEDDYLSDLSFTQGDNSTLKSLDHQERVIYLKSFSKILMPGLRLGFLVIPHNLQEHLLLAKHNSDISTSGLLQRAFELYLRRGIWQQHIKHMEENYRERFDAMVKALGEYMPKAVTYQLPKGGVNFWLKLPKGHASRLLYNEAKKENIVFAPGGLFFVNNSDDSYFRLSIAAVNSTEIEYGIKILARIIDNFINHRSPGFVEGEIKPIL